MAVKLEPADLDRCQAETIVYNALIMGGNVLQHLRCKNIPHWLVLERKRGKDGLKGSMSLCDGCAQRFIKKQVLPPTHYDMEWIAKE